MAKTAKKKSDTPAAPAADTAPKALHVTEVSEALTFSVRVNLSDGTHIDLLAAGGGSFEANKALQQKAVEALSNTLRA